MTRHSTRRHALALLGTTAAAWAALPLVATAAGYPERPVTVVVPYSPGGGVDIITRLVTPPMAERWASPWWWTTSPAAAPTSAWARWHAARPTATCC